MSSSTGYFRKVIKVDK